MNAERQYFYVADPLDITNGFGEPLKSLKEHAFTFVAPARQAHGTLFVKGYNMDSEEGLFEDNGSRFVSEMFQTTDSTNSTEDDVPDRLSILFPDHPYVRVYPQARFGVLHVHRTPMTAAKGGSRRRKSRRSKKTRKTKARS